MISFSWLLLRSWKRESTYESVSLTWVEDNFLQIKSQYKGVWILKVSCPFLFSKKMLSLSFPAVPDKKVWIKETVSFNSLSSKMQENAKELLLSNKEDNEMIRRISCMFDVKSEGLLFSGSSTGCQLMLKTWSKWRWRKIKTILSREQVERDS